MNTLIELSNDIDNISCLLLEALVEIKLTKGKVAIIDEEDWELVKNYSWHYQSSSCGEGYAIGWITVNGERRHILMHRFILDIIDQPNVVSDHRDGNGLNNRRSNLKITIQPNNCLAKHRKNRRNKSGYNGVVWNPNNCNWRARVRFRGKTTEVGSFDDKIEAARAYDTLAKQLFGEFFVNLNFPDEH